MPTRAETAAATRRALLDAATDLLDAGGPEAVTLREVGARAGVSRSAPYRHFADKVDLLGAVAAEAWERMADDLEALDTVSDPRAGVRAALLAILHVSRTRRHVYSIMFIPAAAEAPVARAAAHAQGVYLRIVADLVGDDEAWRYGGLLLTSAHGMAGLDSTGQILGNKWPRPEELLDLLVERLPMRATQRSA